MGKKSRGKSARDIQPRREKARPASANTLPWTTREWTIVALLAALTVAIFGQVASHVFLNLDDGQFIYENGTVLQGLSGSSIAWALTSADIGWYPLTWLSHMLDISLWGPRAGAHLLTNALLHLVSACLLFAALRRLTRAAWPAAFVAALFAIHPMHVESVAWASERKDTLSTLFAMLALLFYARDPRRRLPVALALTASLAAKQMYVTLLPLLLVLDWWPLGRLRNLRDLHPRVVEKLPLFALSIAGSAIAVIGQRNLNALQSTATIPLGHRFGNALVSYCRYLGKLFVPVDLALPYPYEPISGAKAAAAAALLLLAITAGCLLAARRLPALLAGWLWFVGILVPVIGVVQIGTQSLADRYSYFAYVGIFVAVAYSAIALPIPRRVLVAAGTLAVAIYAAIAFHQVRYWKNSETLFAHAIAVTADNAQAEYLLGQALQMSEPDRAIAHLRRSVEIVERTSAGGSAYPDWYAQCFVGIGTSELVKARSMPATSPARATLIADAKTQLQHALRINGQTPHAKNNLGVADQMLAEGRAPGRAN
jgi:tetratricopeptide (TPR) repeat protein